MYKFALEKSGRVYFNVSKMSYICFSHASYLYLFYYESDFKSISFRLCIYFPCRECNFKIEINTERLCSIATKDAAYPPPSMYNSLRRFKVPKSISPDDKGEVARD